MHKPDREAFAVYDIRRQDRDDGSIILRNAVSLPSPIPDIIDRFLQWAEANPEAVLVSETSTGARRVLTYGEAAQISASLGSRLIARGCRPGKVICVITGAGCDHAIVKLACLRASLVHAPLSPALIASETGRSRLKEMIQICQPEIIVCDQDSISTLEELETGCVAEIISLSSLISEAKRDADNKQSALYEIQNSASPEDLSAIYFTSGSTGAAKGVQITRGMIGAVQSAVAAHWPFLAHDRPVIADWLPWHHVFGGLDNFFKMVWNGGAYHFRSAPQPSSIAETAALIAETRPSIYIDVPLGIKLLLQELENDPEICAAFFSRLELIFFAGAGMDSETWSRLNNVLRQSTELVRPSLRLGSGYGSTEAGSTICLAHEQPDGPGEIGVPLPGHALRIAEVDGVMEIRVRGPNVSPGYIDLNGSRPMPLDELGFLKTGDVAAPVRPLHPELGLRFDGRLAEDFKLTNGTRVRVGALRQILLAACAPYIADIAIAGETQDYLSALLFTSPAADELDVHTKNRFFEKALAEHNDQWSNSSMAIRRAIVLDGSPDPESGEVNDKGHLVQRRCLQNRHADVQRLYSKQPDRDIIVVAMPDSE